MTKPAEAQFRPDSFVPPHLEQLITQVDRQAAIPGTAEAEYVGFDDVANGIWRQIEQKPTLEPLCQTVIADHNGTPEQIRREVLG